MCARGLLRVVLLAPLWITACVETRAAEQAVELHGDEPVDAGMDAREPPIDAGSDSSQLPDVTTDPLAYDAGCNGSDDVDRDGVCAEVDNCPDVYNPDQADVDLDGLGDACDLPCEAQGVPAVVDFERGEISGVSINRRINVVDVAPRTVLSIRYSYRLNACASLNPLDQIQIGYEEASQAVCSRTEFCRISGTTGVGAVDIAAPEQPGIYYIAARITSVPFLMCTVGNASMWLGTEMGERRIAAICVR